MKRDHHVALHHTLLKLKSLPIFYAPILYYPIDEHGRSTGFLLPQIGNSSLKGFIFNQGFFWAISRSQDATFTYERFSEVGNGGSVEYRYIASETSRGEVNTFSVNDSTTGQGQYTVIGSANQELPGGFRSVARVDYFSSFDFQESFQESSDRATQRSKRASATISKSFKQYSLRALFDRNDTAFGDDVAVREVLRRSAWAGGRRGSDRTPVLFGFDSEVVSLARSSGDQIIEYQRFDVAPTVSYPFTGLSYLTFRTSVTARYTYYTSSQTTSGGFNQEDAIDRRYYETAFDMRGPTFARIFNTPENGYAARFKHVIEPQMVLELPEPHREFRPHSEVRRQRLCPRDEPGRLLAREPNPREAHRQRQGAAQPDGDAHLGALAAVLLRRQRVSLRPAVLDSLLHPGWHAQQLLAHHVPRELQALTLAHRELEPRL